MRINLLTVLLLLFLSSCKDETKKVADSTSDATIISLVNPSKIHSSLPRLFSNSNRLFLSWIEKNDSMARLNYSFYEKDLWSDPKEIIAGSDWFVNWADFPAIAENHGNILTSFLQKSANGTYTYDVKLNLFMANSKTWKKNFILHNDGTKSEHGFVSMRPYVANSFVVTWLDGRETVGKNHGGGQMTLRAAIVFEDGTIDHDTLLDDRVCDCCQTATAIGPNDEIIVAYRDRSEDEIRDISIVKWQHNGGWSQPKTIGEDNWKIDGCPVNGPSIDSFETGVAVAWFTAENDNPKVLITFSDDTGETFGLPFRVDNGLPLGRVDVAMISKKSAVISWIEEKGEETLIQLMKVNSDGSKNNTVTISKTSSERASGFPQIEVLGDKIVAAWTDLASETATVRTATILINNL